MELQIIEKGTTFELDIVSKQEGAKQYYFGAGWDNPNGPVDLDIVCVALTDGKLANQSDFVYFGNRNVSGIALSEDNTTGEGEGDDESIVINTGSVADSVNSIVVGLAAYAGADLHSAPNPHFRVCDGSEESSPQVADVVVGGDAQAGNTVLVAFTLTRGQSGWELKNNAEFHSMGQGTEAIKGFGGLYQ